MLVLTRRLGESICINDDIKIVIQSIKGQQVRLGISAPKTTIIHREEIYQKIQSENRQASQLPTELTAMKEMMRVLKQNRSEADNKI